MAIEFKTEQYEWSHGHKPKGRGTWMFVRKASHNLPAAEFMSPSGMSYTEARAWCNRQVRAEGFQDATVVVGA